MLVLCRLISIAVCSCMAFAQNANSNTRNARKHKLNQLRGTSNSNKLFSALTVQYPLHLFELNGKNWKLPASKDSTLFGNNYANSKPWLEASLAQDQEDVWLYENWFYGMRNGIIMESGALDGLLFSNSYLFESYLGWNAIHVGTLILILAFFH